MLRLRLRHLALLGCVSAGQGLFLPATFAGDTSPTSAEPSLVLRLADASAQALEKNPQLIAHRAIADGQRGAVDQAGILPNPTLSWGRQNLNNDALTGTDGEADTLALSQLIELGGKRGDRIALAQSQLQQRELDWQQARAELLAEVRSRYADAQVAQARVALMAELVQISEQTAHAASERVRAGKVAPIEQTKASIALSTIRSQQAQTEREFAVAKARLALLWGESSPSFAAVSDVQQSLPAVPAWQSLPEQLQRSPRWQLADAHVAQRDAERSLADAKAIPDLTFSIARTEFSDLDESSDAVGLSLHLPLFDRNQGGKAEARALQAAAREEQRAVQQQLQLELLALHQDLLGNEQEIASLRREVLPGAEEVFRATLNAYHAGKFGLLDVLDAQRMLFDARQQHLRSLQQSHHRLAELERLLGVSLAALSATQE